MLLNISNLHIDSFQSQVEAPVCRNLNFTVEEGETLGILGESGSGKSITALSVLQLLPPSLHITKGSILFTGKDGTLTDLAQAPEKTVQALRGKEIAMVFQEPMTSLNPVFTCGDQVLEAILQHRMKQQGWPMFRNFFGSELHKEAKKKVASLFQKVRLPNAERVFDSYPYQLSGGQKQRVMIAMAISCNPRLLIADEPTTALDVTVQRSILGLLKDLQAEMGMSVIFISHDINVLSEIAKRALVFNKGEIVEQGEISQIITHPAHSYTRGLMACRSSLKNKEDRLTTIQSFTEQRPKSEKNTTPAPRSNLQSGQPILSIENVNLSFRASGSLFGRSSPKQILYNVNLNIFPHETMGLVGESGSGKTTIGRTVMKLIENESGTVTFRGMPLDKLSNKALKNFRKKVQIIFQDPYSSLNPKHTIGEIISEPMFVHKIFRSAKERKSRVKELLRQVELDQSYLDRYPHQFSGGQRQRIGIARALAVEPEVLILDESVSALDVSIQAQVLNLLNDLKKTYGLTYLFISHDLNIVRYMSDRIVVLKNGRVVETGDAEEVFTSPKNQYTLDLLNSIPGHI